MQDTEEARRWGRTKPLQSGLLLRQMREELRISAKELCAAVGMTQGQLSDIERGVQALSLRRANQIARFFRRPLLELLQQLLQEKLDDAGFAQAGFGEYKVLLALDHASDPNEDKL